MAKGVVEMALQFGNRNSSSSIGSIVVSSSRIVVRRIIITTTSIMCRGGIFLGCGRGGTSLLTAL